MLKRYFLIISLSVAAIMSVMAEQVLDISGRGLPTEYVSRKDLPISTDVDESKLKYKVTYHFLGHNVNSKKVTYYEYNNGKYKKRNTTSGEDLDNVINQIGDYGKSEIVAVVDNKVKISFLDRYTKEKGYFYFNLYDFCYRMEYSFSSSDGKDQEKHAAVMAADYSNKRDSCQLSVGEDVVVLYYVPEMHTARVATRSGEQDVPIASLKLVNKPCNMEVYYATFPEDRPVWYVGLAQSLWSHISLNGRVFSFLTSWQNWYDFKGFVGVVLLIIAFLLLGVGMLLGEDDEMWMAVVSLLILFANMGAGEMNGMVTWFADNEGFWGWFGNTFFQLLFTIAVVEMFRLPFTTWFHAAFEKNSGVLRIVSLLIILMDIPVMIAYMPIYDHGNIVRGILQICAIIGVLFSVYLGLFGNEIKQIVNRIFPPHYSVNIHKVAQQIYDRRVKDGN